MVSPTELSSNLNEVPLFPTEFTPRRVIYSPSFFLNGVIFSYRYSCNHHPQRKQSSTLTQQPRMWLPGTRQGFTFLDENTFIKHHIHHYRMHRRITSYKSHWCWEHHCLIHIMHCIWLTFTFQERRSWNSQSYSKTLPRSDFPAPVKDLLSYTKNTFIKHHIHHYSMHRRIILYKSHLYWGHHCLTHIMHCIWLTFTFQERCSWNAQTYFKAFSSPAKSTPNRFFW